MAIAVALLFLLTVTAVLSVLILVCCRLISDSNRLASRILSEALMSLHMVLVYVDIDLVVEVDGDVSGDLSAVSVAGAGSVDAALADLEDLL